MDYEKLYLEERKRSLSLEMSLLQMRADKISKEAVEISKELEKYENKSENPETK